MLPCLRSPCLHCTQATVWQWAAGSYQQPSRGQSSPPNQQVSPRHYIFSQGTCATVLLKLRVIIEDVK